MLNFGIAQGAAKFERQKLVPAQRFKGLASIQCSHLQKLTADVPVSSTFPFPCPQHLEIYLRLAWEGGGRRIGETLQVPAESLLLLKTLTINLSSEFLVEMSCAVSQKILGILVPNTKGGRHSAEAWRVSLYTHFPPWGKFLSHWGKGSVRWQQLIGSRPAGPRLRC